VAARLREWGAGRHSVAGRGGGRARGDASLRGGGLGPPLRLSTGMSVRSRRGHKRLRLENKLGKAQRCYIHHAAGWELCLHLNVYVQNQRCNLVTLSLSYSCHLFPGRNQLGRSTSTAWIGSPFIRYSYTVGGGGRATKKRNYEI
jgi:hypothetical protein